MGFGFWPDGHWAVGFWPDGFWVDQDKIQPMGSAKPVGEIARYIERKRLPRTIRVAEFNGVDSKIDAGADCIGIGPVTVCCWVRALTNGGGDGSMLFWNGAIFACFVGNSIVFTSLWNTEVTTPYTYWKQWKHLAITRNELGNASIYLDGVLVGDPDRFSGVPSSATTQLIIGNWASGNRPVYGNMADFAIFNRLLNPYEIKQVMTNGIPQTGVEGDLLLDLRLSKSDVALGPELVSNGGFDDASGWITDGWAISGGEAHVASEITRYVLQNTVATQAGKVYQHQFAITAYAKGYLQATVEGGTGAPGRYPKPGYTATGTHITILRASAAGKVGVYANGATTATIDNVSVREYWLTDLSPHARRAYPQNAPSWVTLPSGLSVLDFNGTTDLLDCGSDFIGTGDVTFECWIRPETFKMCRIIGNNKTILYLYKQAEIERLYLASGAAGGYATGVIINQWTHVMATRKSDGYVNIYLNGALSGDPDQYSGAPGAGDNVIVGNSAIGDRAFDGQISGVRVYQGIKSPEFIYNRYQSTRGYYLDSGYTIPPASRSGLALHYALTSQDAPSGIYDNWAHWLPIRIDHTKIDEDLTDFPVLVSLDESNFDFTKARSNGYDIRFIGPDGVSLLSYERVSHDAVAKTAEYWVKVPKVKADSDTPIALLYGNPGAGDGANGTDVWSNGFAAVWHMNDETSSTIKDSTSNGNHGTKKGANEPVEAAGVIGGAQSFDGVNDYVNCGSGPSFDITNTITLTAFVKQIGQNIYGYSQEIVGKRQTGIQGGGCVFKLMSNEMLLSLNGSNRVVTPSFNLSMNVWTYLAGTYDSQTGIGRGYVNGVKKGTDIIQSGNIDSYPNNPVAISSSLYIFNGLIDEVRISSVARSAAWIKADYNSVNNTLLTIGGAHD